MNAWSEKEVEAIVSDYFDMLSKELSGQRYVKALHRRDLLPLLENRSEGSIEFKYQNVSAVLINLGQPYIKGYLPRYNYQKILEDKVIDYLVDHQTIENQFRAFAENKIFLPDVKYDFSTLLVDAPVKNPLVEEPMAAYRRSLIKTNYFEIEQRNRQLGMLGEELVLMYEQWQLRRSGKDNLADRVRWISKEEGDGAGFDILSSYPNGGDKYIEVKTTRLGKETPFFFSHNEMLFSQRKADSYHLYRLFSFDENARMFVKSGRLDEICRYTPVQFKGYF